MIIIIIIIIIVIIIIIITESLRDKGNLENFENSSEINP